MSAWFHDLVYDGDRVDGWVFLVLSFLISVGAFLNGLRFARMTDEEALDRRVLIEGALAFSRRGRPQTKGDAARLFGRVSMIAAPIFFLFVAALCLGLLGSVADIAIIKLT